jgi:hypothetical protein
VVKTFKCGRHFSNDISEVSSKIPSEGITLKGFLDTIGQKGLLMSIMILTVPFLLPVSIPGLSIPLGAAIFLMSISIIFKKIFIFDFLMNYKLSKNYVDNILNGSLSILTRLEKFINPRLLILSTGSTMNYINGSLIAFSAIILMIPLPIPLTDFLPGYTILFLAVGALECDGYLILAGYLMVIITTVYFSLMAILGVKAILIIFSYLGL